jgi:hypothetical protein
LRYTWQVEDRPLPRPDHLGAPAPRPWLVAHGAGAAALALGVIAFVVVMVAQDAPWSTPDWRLSVPGFVLTAAAAGMALARRERSMPLWLSGLGLATAALVLGWVLMLSIVIGATVVLVLIFHSVM